jgi:hypothetical protein
MITAGGMDSTQRPTASDLPDSCSLPRNRRFSALLVVVAGLVPGRRNPELDHFGQSAEML